jgi:hypothetical protein
MTRVPAVFISTCVQHFVVTLTVSSMFICFSRKILDSTVISPWLFRPTCLPCCVVLVIDSLICDSTVRIHCRNEISYVLYTVGRLLLQKIILSPYLAVHSLWIGSVADTESHSFCLLNLFSKGKFGTDVVGSDLKFLTCVNRCLFRIPIQ